MGVIETVSRRSFLISTAVVGGGLAIGLNWTADAAGASGSEFTQWLSIAPDNTVTVRSPMPDWGQGTATQWAMIIAEELNVDWSTIKIEYQSPQRMYVDNKAAPPAPGAVKVHFSGARSTHELRIAQGTQLGASARERLKAAAAAQWKVPVSEITATNSLLTHTPTGRTLTYGNVAAKAATIKLDKEPAPKPRSEWTLLGKASPGKIQNTSIVNGSAVFGMDVRVPGMVYAALRQPPTQGGTLKSYDDSVARKMPGVLAVVTVDPKESAGYNDPSLPLPYGKGGMALSVGQHGIAVIAEHYWQARKALDALRVEWDDGEGAKWTTTEMVNETARALLDSGDLKVEKSEGDVALIDQQKKVVEGFYRTPYCEQCTMEPLNGTALVTPDRVEVWAPAQQSAHAHVVAVDETGMPPEKVTFHQTQVGGGFGRRIYADDIRMVVAVARKFQGRPVHVIWSREETMRQGRYRSLMNANLRAGLDEKTGLPVAVHARYATGPGGATSGLHDTPYGFNKNFKVEGGDLPFNVISGAYRGPGYNSLAFITETFIDECAHAAGVDPVEYRLKLLDGYADPGWALCLKEAAGKSGWGKSLPKGMGMGVAISNWGGTGKPHTGTTVATVATVEVTKAGVLKIHQLDVAFDSGGVMNPGAMRSQMIGGTVFGLNMTLNEGLNVRNGRIVEGNFDQYPMLRAGDMPTQINIHFGGLSGHSRFSEAGEPPAGVVGPAVGNAIFAATGKRLRTTPFRLHDLSWA